MSISIEMFKCCLETEGGSFRESQNQENGSSFQEYGCKQIDLEQGKRLNLYDKNLPQRNAQVQTASLVNSTTFKEGLITIFHKLFQKLKRRTPPNSFYEAILLPRYQIQSKIAQDKKATDLYTAINILLGTTDLNITSENKCKIQNKILPN